MKTIKQTFHIIKKDGQKKQKLRLVSVMNMKPIALKKSREEKIEKRRKLKEEREENRNNWLISMGFKKKEQTVLN